MHKFKLVAKLFEPHKGHELAIGATSRIILLYVEIIKDGTEIRSSSDAFVNPKGHKIGGSLLGNLRDSHHGFGP